MYTDIEERKVTQNKSKILWNNLLHNTNLNKYLEYSYNFTKLDDFGDSSFVNQIQVNKTIEKVKKLVKAQEVNISEHINTSYYNRKMLMKKMLKKAQDQIATPLNGLQKKRSKKMEENKPTLNPIKEEKSNINAIKAGEKLDKDSLKNKKMVLKETESPIAIVNSNTDYLKVDEVYGLSGLRKNQKKAKEKKHDDSQLSKDRSMRNVFDTDNTIIKEDLNEERICWDSPKKIAVTPMLFKPKMKARLSSGSPINNHLVTPTTKREDGKTSIRELFESTTRSSIFRDKDLKDTTLISDVVSNTHSVNHLSTSNSAMNLTFGSKFKPRNSTIDFKKSNDSLSLPQSNLDSRRTSHQLISRFNKLNITSILHNTNSTRDLLKNRNDFCNSLRKKSQYFHPNITSRVQLNNYILQFSPNPDLIYKKLNETLNFMNKQEQLRAETTNNEKLILEFEKQVIRDKKPKPSIKRLYTIKGLNDILNSEAKLKKEKDVYKADKINKISINYNDNEFKILKKKDCIVDFNNLQRIIKIRQIMNEDDLPALSEENQDYIEMTGDINTLKKMLHTQPNNVATWCKKDPPPRFLYLKVKKK